MVGGFFAGAETILGVTGWRWVFLINVPIGILAMIVVVPRAAPAARKRATTGSTARARWRSSSALVPLLIVAEQGRDLGLGLRRSMACYVIGVLGVVAFILAERGTATRRCCRCDCSGTARSHRARPTA